MFRNVNKIKDCYSEEVQSTDVVGLNSSSRGAEGDVVISNNKVLTNSESLFARAACSRRSPRSLRSLVMTFSTLTLAAILSTSIISDSWAECIAVTAHYTKLNCYENNDWNPGVVNNCGNGCTYYYDEDNHKLTVTATKADAIIPEGRFSPAYYENGILPTISNIEIAGEFSSIGMHAFLDGSATISGKNGKLVLPANSWNAFERFGGTTLKGEIEISPNVDKIGSGAFHYAKIDGTLIIPDNIKSIDAMAFYALRLAKGAKIYCAIDNCAEKILDSCKQAKANPNLSINTCKQILEEILKDEAKFEQAPEGCAYLSANGCKKCKNENFRLNDGECDRLRYTPAEAAAVLHDDNTNSVTITFKK